MTQVRQAAAAGMFYPGAPGELAAQVHRYLAEAATPSAGDAPPKAIIAPHAGYVYSGAIAASAYARLVPAADRIHRVVLMGPCHRVAVRGIAVSSAEAFATPLGSIPVDAAARDAILALPQVSVFDATHTEEHSLEVHLPFLQELLDRFTLVPLVVGQASAAQVAEVIETLWGGEETVFVISSDLSHYLDYDSARALDGRTCAAIEALDPDAISYDQACGRVPVAGMLTVAKRRGMTVATLDLRNSGDTAGDRRRVVGYGAWMFTEPQRKAAAPAGGFGDATRRLLDRHGATLLKLAAASIRHGLASGRALAVETTNHPEELRAPGASFVTLTRSGTLRGCIGSPMAHRPLVQDVAANAFAAAFSDGRFPPLNASEIDGLDLSVSVLSPQEEMLFAGEGHLLEQLTPGVDGLIIESCGRRALFLPAVWDQLPQKRTFLDHLRQKAGLSADHWAGDFRAWRFHTVAVKSADLDEPASLWA